MKKLFSFGMALLAALSINATDYYFAGDASGWSEKNESFKFVEENGVLTLHVADLYGEFKIVENATWHPQHGGAYEGEVAKVEFNKPYTLTKELDGKGDPKNVAFDLAENYRYKDATLTLDATNPDALVITLVSGTPYDHSGTPNVYYLIGACTNNWSLQDAIPFEDKNGVLTANVPNLNGGFKIIINREWKGEWCMNDTKKGLEMNVPYTLGKVDNLSLANPFGTYDNAVLTLDTTDMVLTLVSGDFKVMEANWYLPGEALGWNCTEDQQFAPVEGKTNTYELLAAEFSGEFKVVYGNWAIEFVADAEDTPWTINEEYTCALKGQGKDNIKPADAEKKYTDCTITLVVDYEAVSVKVTISSEVTALNDATIATKATKVIENGQLYILKDGVRYNALGAVVAE